MSEKISIQKKDLLQLPAPVTERIKTVRDAMEELGDDHPFVIQFKAIIVDDTDSTFQSLFERSDLSTYLRLRIVCAALNEGWKPSFTEGEVRWYPWFVRYSDAKMAKSSGWKGSSGLPALDNYLIYRQFVTAFTYVDNPLPCNDRASSLSGAFNGDQLALKSEALANYAGRQFATLWADLFLS